MNESTNFFDLNRAICDIAFAYHAVRWLEALPSILRSTIRFDGSDIQCYRLSLPLSEGIGVATDSIGKAIVFSDELEWVKGLPVESFSLNDTFFTILVRGFDFGQRKIPEFAIQLTLPTDGNAKQFINAIKDEIQLGLAVASKEGVISRVNSVFSCSYSA